MENKHRLPWFHPASGQVRDNFDNLVAQVESTIHKDYRESLDDAEFIVRAVNSHDALVAALKEMMCVYGQCLPDHCNADWFDDYNRAVAALAAAGEQP